MTAFSDFGLAAPILKALAAEGYETPTPIQAQAIPLVMTGRDLLGIAQTGTGKTAAFSLPMLHRLAASPTARKPRSCRALILSPTRELASQIADSIKAYGRNLRVAVEVIFGGVPVGRQQRALAQGVDILVATPGRLLDLISQRALTLADVEILVLDEADQMLDLGFIHDLKRIVRMLPPKRQSLFFSATMPTTIAGLAGEYLTDPAKVSVAPVATTAERVDQQVIFVPTAHKQSLLAHILRDPAVERVLVFTRTKHGADRVVRHLEKAGISGAAIHGNKSQGQRERALGAFRAGTCKVLVATDIAARGIDVEGVTHVINFDLPNVPEQYVHRIGRTARAGASGLAISFCNGEERAYLKDIEKLTRMKVPVAELPAGFTPERLVEADEPPRERQPQRARQGQRPQRPGQGQRPAQGQRAGGRPDQSQGERRADSAPRGQRPAQPGGEAKRQGEPNRQGELKRQGEPRRGGRPQGAAPRKDGARAEGGQIGWLGAGSGSGQRRSPRG